MFDTNICVHLEKCKTETHHCGLRFWKPLYLPKSIYKQRTSKHTHTPSVSISISVSEYKSMLVNIHDLLSPNIIASLFLLFGTLCETNHYTRHLFNSKING